MVKLFFLIAFTLELHENPPWEPQPKVSPFEGFEKNSKDRHSLTLHPGQVAAGVWGGDLKAWHGTGLSSQRLGPKSRHVGNPCPLSHAQLF